MELKHFIYNYSLFLQKTVLETISDENWTRKDFDNRYIEYFQGYHLLKSRFLYLDDLKFQENIEVLNEQLKEKFCRTMKDILYSSIVTFKGISTEEYEKVVVELTEFEKSKEFSFGNFIKIIREIEERILST